MKKKKIKDYCLYDGFYDLREFDIPDKDFLKLWTVQQFLYEVEERRKRGFKHPQIQSIREMSG